MKKQELQKFLEEKCGIEFSNETKRLCRKSFRYDALMLNFSWKILTNTLLRNNKKLKEFEKQKKLLEEVPEVILFPENFLIQDQK